MDDTRAPDRLDPRDAEWDALVAEADVMAQSGNQLRGFLETPAIVLAAAGLARDEAPLAAGTMVGPYRLIDFLARGGMGDVYRATDTRLHRDVAVKMLASSKTGDPQRVARFMHEARVTASLNHPNIVRVFDVGRTEGGAYLVAELLEGETLRQRVDRGPLAIDDVLRIGGEIAAGLVAAHAAGLVHRDLKPENIFLSHGGPTRILDFGIAKLAQDEQVRDGFSTLTGVVLGTAGYLAPEQIRGSVIDPRADLFALGAVLFEMITGARAFAREHVVETLHAILHDHPPDMFAARADTPPGLAGIVSRLLEKDPAERFGSSAELLTALSNAIAPTRVSPSSPAASSAPRITLAVMPFRTIAADAASDFLGAGLADVFISRLSQSGVHVLPLTATERMRDQDPRKAARQLGANRVLIATLQRDGGLVRASVHLLSATDERTMCATTVDADASSVFSIQDIIVARLLEELAPHLAMASRVRLAKPGTRNNDAFEAYLRGRVHVSRPTSSDLRLAADYFREALRLDDAYADAWAGLGSAYKRQPVVSGAPVDVFRQAKHAAERALALDADHPEAHSVLGTVAFWHEWDYPRAERCIRRSLELQPGAADTQVFLAHLYSNLGRSDEAIEEIRRARALDPGWVVPRALEGQFLYMARRFEESLAHLDATLAVTRGQGPARLFRIWTLLALGRYDDALDECEPMLIERRPDPLFGPLEMKGVALAHLGRTGDAEAVLEELQSRQRNRAVVFHALRRDDESLAEIARAIDARDPGVTFLGVDPRWDGLRHHPLFSASLARVRLLEASSRVPH
jgi:serine/threonine-protein kinase